MIKVTKLNNDEIVVNADLIEFVEANPDTIISLISGKKIMVKETPREIIQRTAAYRKFSWGIDLKEVQQMNENS